MSELRRAVYKAMTIHMKDPIPWYPSMSEGRMREIMTANIDSRTAK
jgi:hypothetical protein